MKFQVTGNCVVHATVSAEIEADSKEEAEQKMLAMFNADNKSMCVDPALETACDLEAVEALMPSHGECPNCGNALNHGNKIQTTCAQCGKGLCTVCVALGHSICYHCEDKQDYADRLPDGCR